MFTRVNEVSRCHFTSREQQKVGIKLHVFVPFFTFDLVLVLVSYLDFGEYFEYMSVSVVITDLSIGL